MLPTAPNAMPGDGTAAQLQAANPGESIWVSANAGTGKTWVLTNRIARLLIDGTPPSRILCLTFTKAAAAEMANRLSDRLGAWAAIEDTHLDAALEELFGRPPTMDEHAKARRLFAETIEAPEGLRIRTIHSFCESLLGRFPLEAGVAPHFSVIDDRTAAELRTEARDRVLADTFAGKLVPMTRALDHLAGLVDENGFAEAMRELNAARGRFKAAIEDHSSIDALVEAGRRALGLAAAETRDTLLVAAVSAADLDGIALAAAADVLATGSKTDRERAKVLGDWLTALQEERVEAFSSVYFPLFVTQKNEPRAAASLITKKLAAQHPEAEAALLAEQARVLAVHERLKAAAIADATAALLPVGEALLSSYERLKDTRALMDYDDLIVKARRLMQTKGGISWVHYKLDGGLDHILVDEAQDTSPDQWDVIEALTDDFFAGEGLGKVRRTVFAVGDEKQSIYSFQGADPACFRIMEERFGDRVKAAGLDWRSVEIGLSRRSAAVILKVVDAVFAQQDAADGLSWRNRAIRHGWTREGQGGLVELWPLVSSEATTEQDPWDAPLDHVSAASPPARLASQIATRIRSWIDNGDLLESAGRPIRPDDIMILIRTRSAFAEEMVRALKLNNVPVAGRDRMVLTEHLAVMDLIALGRFTLLPDDDLNTATVLKGPFIEMDEDALFALAHCRDGTLWNALRARAAERPDFTTAAAILSRLLGAADYQPPYEFYASVLGADGGERSLLAHLGTEAREPVEEFLTLALQFERQHAPSMEGFLHWIEVGETEVKRDLEHGHGEVRVMTVHGAKGLQANIVFIADTCSPPRRQRDPKILWQQGHDGVPGFVLWQAFRDNEEAVSRALREATHREIEREYRRLLYVAMTRARDRLYIAGWKSERTSTESSWYEMIEAAVDDRWREVEIENGEIGRRLETPQTAPPDGATNGLPLEGMRASLPTWALSPATEETAQPQPLAPSQPDTDEPPVFSPLGDDGNARFKRGQLIHSLLQTLPGLEPAARDAVARRFLALAAHGLGVEQQEMIAREIACVLDDPAMAPLFGPDSLVEVPITGVVGEGCKAQVVAGQVDRLVIGDDQLTVIDYKTNRPPPQTEQEVAPVYLRQMAAYRDVLRCIYPKHRVKTVLLWTDGPQVMTLSDAILDTASP